MSLFFKPSAQTTSVITNGLVSRWTFEDTADTSTLTDVTGSNDGTINGMAYGSGSTGRPTGVTGQNYGSFDGTDDRVVIGQPSNLNFTSAFTVLGWMSVGSSVEQAPLIAKGDTQYALKYNSFADNAVFFVHDGSFHPVSSSISSGWRHLAGRFDGTNVDLFVDGSKVASTTGGINSNAFDLAIGYNDEQDRYADGLIDGVRAYGRALSTSEISDIYNGNG